MKANSRRALPWFLIPLFLVVLFAKNSSVSAFPCGQRSLSKPALYQYSGATAQVAGSISGKSRNPVLLWDTTTARKMSGWKEANTHNQRKKEEEEEKQHQVVYYKDDCFGFLAFLGGIATKDPFFLGIFLVLSLASDAGTRLGFLPPDEQRPSIVDRRVPAAVAASTLILTAILAAGPLSVSLPEPFENARTIQWAIGSFSIATGTFGIRWRDRFDYPEEYR